MRKPIRRGIVAFFVMALYALPGTVFAAGDEPEPQEPEKPATEEGRKLIEARKFSEAVAVFEKAVAADPGNASAWNYLAFSNRKLGRLDAAMKYYKKALAIDPDHKGAHQYIAELYLQLGRIEPAKRHFAVLKKLCPAGCAGYDDLEGALAALRGGG